MLIICYALLKPFSRNHIPQALDLVPKKIHERSPIFLGSYDDVEEIKALYAAEENKEWTFLIFHVTCISAANSCNITYFLQIPSHQKYNALSILLLYELIDSRFCVYIGLSQTQFRIVSAI